MYQEYDSLREKAVKFADYDYIDLALSLETALPLLAPFERWLLNELFVTGIRIETLSNELSLSAPTLLGIVNSSLERLRDDLRQEGVSQCPATSTNNAENV